MPSNKLGRRALRKAAKSRNGAAARIEEVSDVVRHNETSTPVYVGESSEPVTDHNPITSRNSRSPLLRLPAEIRNQIWELAFGHRTVHPRALRGSLNWVGPMHTCRASRWGVSYDPCQEIYSDHHIYELSLRDPELDHWHTDMLLSTGGVHGYHDCDSVDLPRPYYYLVPPVCKQLWSEASVCAWKTVTFAFVRSGDFQYFVHFSGARLDLIKQLCIISPGHSRNPSYRRWEFDRAWIKALKSVALSKFTSLRGLHLILRFYSARAHQRCLVTNLERPPEECEYLPDIICQFQKLKLHPGHTTVLIINSEHSEPYGSDSFTVPMRRKLAQLIRNLILAETPVCDWSGPRRAKVLLPSNSVDGE